MSQSNGPRKSRRIGSWEQNLHGDTHNAQQNAEQKDRTRQRTQVPTHLWEVLGFFRARTGTDINTQRHALTTC